MHLTAWIVAALQTKTEVPGPIRAILDFLDTPAPYSPFSEYIAVLLFLWLLARRENTRKKTFDSKAQEVLEQKLAAGEIDRKTYEKFRQDVSLRPKR
jgi:hypothetical protein